MIVKFSEVVVLSGKVPTILIEYVPRGLDFDTEIFPSIEFTPIISVA